MDYEDSNSSPDPFADETPTFAANLKAALTKEWLTDSEVKFLENTLLELKDRSSKLKKAMRSRARDGFHHTGEFVIDPILMSRFKNTNILMTQVDDKLAEVSESPKESVDLKKHLNEIISTTKKIEPSFDATGFRVVDRSEDRPFRPSRKIKSRVPRREYSRFSRLRRYMKSEVPEAYKLLENVVNHPEQFNKRFWSGTGLAKFLGLHFYLLFSTENKIVPLKQTYERILQNLAITEAKVAKVNTSDSQFKYMMYETPQKHTPDKLQVIKYLRRRLILREVSYCFCHYMRGSNASVVINSAPNADDLTEEETLLVYEQALDVKDRADDWNTPIWNQKQLCQELRGRIEDLGWNSNARKKNVRKMRDTLIRSFVNYCKKTYEIMEAKIELYKYNTDANEKKMQKLKTERGKFKAESKILLKKYNYYAKLHGLSAKNIEY